MLIIEMIKLRYWTLMKPHLKRGVQTFLLRTLIDWLKLIQMIQQVLQGTDCNLLVLLCIKAKIIHYFINQYICL